MRRSQKTKRVSWASDVSLCQDIYEKSTWLPSLSDSSLLNKTANLYSQVRLFLSEESPSQVVLRTDHLQEKASGDNEAGENFPPGFGQIQPANLWRIKLSQIPLIKWRRPVRFEVNNEWEVVAGEESKEVEAQSQREMSVLEAIYPRPSSIPPNPRGLLNVEGPTANGRNTPLLIPVTPIEEEDGAPLDASLNSPTPISQPQISQAALTAILSNSGQGNLIDQELLLKILNNPKMVEQLTSSHHNASSSAQNGPPTRIQNKPSNATQYIPPNLRPPTNNPQFVATDQRHTIHPNATLPTPNGSFYPTTATTQIRPPAIASAPVKKDINYFKSLIQQHGRERQDSSLMSPGQNFNLVNCRASKQRIVKPCMYYNSPKGCRNGTNCTYQHDVSSQNGVHGFPEVHNAKRLKMDREITGR